MEKLRHRAEKRPRRTQRCMAGLDTKPYALVECQSQRAPHTRPGEGPQPWLFG